MAALSISTPSHPLFAGDPVPPPKQEILSEVTEIMRDVFDVDDLAVTSATTAEDVEEWDSLSHIRLIVAIERRFGFKFKNSEIQGLNNVGELVNMVETKVG
jgi:acyl carrier protein